jgi:FdhD protein
MSTTKVEHVVRWENGGSRIDADELAQEEPLEIRVRGRGISVTMRTPGHDDALAAGFLLTEGINVQLSPEVPVDFDRLTRHVFASSSCGLCGKATIDAIQNRFPTLAEPSLPQIDAEQVAKMPDLMRQSQSIFDRTGGLHAAGLFDLSGKLLVLHEDIGRHNAVDKVLGHALLDGLHPLTHHVLLVSGRISFEIMQKALAARVPIVAAVSAPTNLAVHFAQESGQTLIAFLRGKRMNIYTFPDRILRA